MHLCGFHGITPALSVQWVMSMCIEKIFVFAVPMFFMITGATLIDYPQKYDDKTYFKKRISKVLIPWLAWGGVSFLYYYCFNRKPDEIISITNVINGILNNEYRRIYWFFPVIISIYLSLPIFAYVEDNKKKQVFSYIVTAGFIINTFLPEISNLLGLGITIPFQISIVSGYFNYVLIGYLLTHYEYQNKTTYFALLSMSIVSLIIQVIGTGVLSLHDGQENTLFRESTMLNCCYAVGVFALGKKHGNTIMSNKIVMKVVDTLSKYTLSIYLIHQFANNLVQKVFAFCGVIVEGTILYQLFGPILAIAISVLVARILRKIPYLRKIVP